MKSDKSALWDEWNAGGGPKYPHEKVIQFTFRNFPKNARHGKKALDLGCGSGVHSVFLASEGFDLYLNDISQTGVHNTLRELKNRGLNYSASEVCSIENTSFEEVFDLVVSTGVFDSAGIEVASSSIKKVSSLLKKGGKGIFVFASDKDFRVTHQENLWNLHGYTFDQVRTMFGSCPWAKLNIDRYITTFENGSLESNDFLVTLEK